MADSYIQVTPDSTGKKVDTSEITVGANVVERERDVLSDPVDPAGLAQVINTTPAGTEYGLVVRTIGSVSTGGLTDTQLRATPVPVSGTVTTGGLTDTQLRASPVPVSGTFFQATQPVSGTVAVSNLPATQPVSGTVAVSNFPATQPVSGTVTANLGTVDGLALDATLTSGSEKVQLVDASLNAALLRARFPEQTDLGLVMREVNSLPMLELMRQILEEQRAMRVMLTNIFTEDGLNKAEDFNPSDFSDEQSELTTTH